MEEQMSDNKPDRGDFGMPMIGTPMKGAPEFDIPLESADRRGLAEELGPDGYPASDVAGVPWTAAPGRVIDMPDYVMRIKQDEVNIDYGMQGVVVPAVTPEARYILAKVLPRLLQNFLESNAKYARAQSGHDLGLKGIIPDINRKTSALITRIWDEQEAGRDSTPEIIDDLIGHLLLMRGKMGLMS
jgi:hypothetical protein